MSNLPGSGRSDSVVNARGTHPWQKTGPAANIEELRFMKVLVASARTWKMLRGCFLLGPALFFYTDAYWPLSTRQRDTGFAASSDSQQCAGGVRLRMLLSRLQGVRAHEASPRQRSPHHPHNSTPASAATCNAVVGPRGCSPRVRPSEVHVRLTSHRADPRHSNARWQQPRFQ